MGNAATARENGRKFGGRKPGSAARYTRAQADAISQSGESPLDVMMNNMLFWHRGVQSLNDQVSEAFANVNSEEDRQEAMGLLKKLFAAREQSQRCAVDMAPYCHPKLANIQFEAPKRPVDDTPQVTKGMSPKEAFEAYQRSIAK